MKPSLKMPPGLKMIFGAAALGVAGLVATAPVSSAAAQGFTLSFNVGNVAFAYTDGYYDHNRRWHRWRSDRERVWYMNNHRNKYYAMKRDRDRDRDRRWRDWDRSRHATVNVPALALSFIAGNVAFAYTDGYYDNSRRWHSWKNDSERQWFMKNHRGKYHAMKRDRDRDRDRDRRWRDRDRYDGRDRDGRRDRH